MAPPTGCYPQRPPCPRANQRVLLLLLPSIPGLFLLLQGLGREREASPPSLIPPRTAAALASHAPWWRDGALTASLCFSVGKSSSQTFHQEAAHLKQQPECERGGGRLLSGRVRPDPGPVCMATAPSSPRRVAYTQPGGQVSWPLTLPAP